MLHLTHQVHTPTCTTKTTSNTLLSSVGQVIEYNKQSSLKAIKVDSLQLVRSGFAPSMGKYSVELIQAEFNFDRSGVKPTVFSDIAPVSDGWNLKALSQTPSNRGNWVVKFTDGFNPWYRAPGSRAWDYYSYLLVKITPELGSVITFEECKSSHPYFYFDDERYYLNKFIHIK